MRNGRRHTVATSLGGLLGGLVGTAAIQKAMGLSQKLPERLRPPQLASDPGHYLVSRAEELRGGPLSPAMHRRAVTASHWLYGLAWAGGLAALAPRLRMDRLGTALGAGAGLGALTWAAGYLGWLPAAGIVKPVTRERASKTAMGLASHVLFGLLAALPIHLAERQFRRERIVPRLFERWA